MVMKPRQAASIVNMPSSDGLASSVAANVSGATEDESLQIAS